MNRTLAESFQRIRERKKRKRKEAEMKRTKKNEKIKKERMRARNVIPGGILGSKTEQFLGE